MMACFYEIMNLVLMFTHLMQGFSSWSRKDFNTFIRACERYGRNDIKSIASEMEGKTEEEVERYAKVFKERYKELNGMTILVLGGNGYDILIKKCGSNCGAYLCWHS